MFTPILVHLSENLRELYHFYCKTPQILTVQFRLYEIHEFFVKKQVTRNDI